MQIQLNLNEPVRNFRGEAMKTPNNGTFTIGEMLIEYYATNEPTDSGADKLRKYKEGAKVISAIDENPAEPNLLFDVSPDELTRIEAGVGRLFGPQVVGFVDGYFKDVKQE